MEKTNPRHNRANTAKAGEVMIRAWINRMTSYVVVTIAHKEKTMAKLKKKSERMTKVRYMLSQPSLCETYRLSAISDGIQPLYIHLSEANKQ